MSDEKKRWEDESSQEGTGLFQDFRGVPTDAWKSKGELMLSQQRDTLDAIREQNLMMRERSSLDYSGIVTPKVEVLPPEVHVDVPRLGDDPAFMDLVDAQKEVAVGTNRLGLLSKQALEEYHLHTDLLGELGSQGRRAVKQRDCIVSELVRSNSSLFSIDRGIQGTNMRLDVLGQGLTSLLGDMGDGIEEMTNEMVRTRMEVLEMLKKMQGVFLWSHRENMWIQRQIYDTLTNPRRTQSAENWKIGEKCRLVGDFRNATTMFQEGLKVNPSEPRNYFSLGMMELAVGRSKKAYGWFETSTQYALVNNDPKLAAYSLMHLAKVKMFDKKYTEASKILQDALKLDMENLECWYELAICECQERNYEDAWKIVQGLLQRSKKYIVKMIAEPVLFPLHTRINQYIRSLYK